MEKIMKQKLRLLGLGLLGASLLIACERGGKKVKIGKPPNPLVTQRQAPVKGSTIDTNKQAMVRSANIKVADIVAQMGGFTYSAKATYTYQHGKKTVRLVRTYRLQQHSDGSFRVRLNNSKDQGYEALWDGQKLYTRNRYRPFRVVSTEVAIAHRWQRKGYGRWRAILGLFGKRLALSQAGTSSVAGRTCVAYTVALHQQEQPIKLPKQGTAWDGPVPDHTRGNASKMDRTLLNAEGKVWFDQIGGFVCQIDFKGKYKFGNGKQSAIANIAVTSRLVSVGDPAIKAPTKVAKITGEKDPLDPFAGANAPSYMQPPPSRDDKKKKRRRKRKRR